MRTLNGTTGYKRRVSLRLALSHAYVSALFLALLQRDVEAWRTHCRYFMFFSSEYVGGLSHPTTSPTSLRSFDTVSVF